MYISGWFTQVNGETRRDLAALDATNGRLKDLKVDVNYTIDLLALSGNKLIIGGSFKKVNGQARQGIAALDRVTGALLSQFNPPASLFNNRTVTSLETADDSVIVGTGYYLVGGDIKNKGRRILLKLSADTGKPEASFQELVFGAGWSSPWVSALTIADSAIFAGGRFFGSHAGNSSQGILKLSFDGKVSSWNPRANGGVFASTRHGRALFLGGNFNKVGGKKRHGLAAVDVTSARVLPWNPYSDHEVDRIASSGNLVAVMGTSITKVNGRSCPEFALLSASSGKLISGSCGLLK